MTRLVVALAVLAVAAVAAATIRAAFTTDTTSPQTLQSVADFLPPVVSALQILGPNGAADVVQAGSTYRVCAQVADQGNPPSGVKSVTADVSQIAGSQSTAILAAGTCTIGSATFNYASTDQTASTQLVSGTTKTYVVTATDQLGQSAARSASALVQAPPVQGCHGTAITATNGGAAVQQIDSGDVILFSFSTEVDQQSIVPGWTGDGSPGPVAITVKDAGSADTITVVNQGTTTPLGTIATKTNFVSGGDATFSGTLTSPGTDIRLTVDYQSGGPGQTVKGAATAMTWTPGTGIKDKSGKPCSTTPVTQPSVTANF
jgi:chitinase